jgi:hypothetical protein
MGIRVRAFCNKVLPKLAIPHLSVKIKLVLLPGTARQENQRQRGFSSARMKSTVFAGREALAWWCVE